MRIAKMIVAGSVTALVATMPALAKDTESRKSEAKSTSASCHAYQQAADGSWAEVPCEEAGGSHTQHRPPAKGGEDEPR
jgi:hypothetical protein